jgi:hypothetical protein
VVLEARPTQTERNPAVVVAAVQQMVLAARVKSS